MNIGVTALDRLTDDQLIALYERESSIDIELTESLVARVRPTDGPSTYEIRVAILVNGYLIEQGEAFEATFCRDFDNAVTALQR